IGAGADVRSRVIGWEAVVQIESRLITTQRTVEPDLRVEAVQRHAAAPTRVKRLGIKNAVAGVDDRLVVHPIGEADARRKRAVKGSLRITHASASRTPFVTGIYYASGQISSAGVRANIKESKLVTGL